MSDDDDDFPPFQAHSETSRQAAASVAERAPAHRKRVFLAILNSTGGLTDEEVQDAMIRYMAPNGPRARRVELEDRGLVEDSGVTRTTRAGQQAVVWRATCGLDGYPDTWPSKRRADRVAQAIELIKKTAQSGTYKAEIEELREWLNEARRAVLFGDGMNKADR